MNQRMFSESQAKKIIRYAQIHGMKEAAKLFNISEFTVSNCFFRLKIKYQRKIYAKKCAICGIKFSTIYDLKKFCGPKCRVKAQNECSKLKTKAKERNSSISKGDQGKPIK